MGGAHVTDRQEVWFCLAALVHVETQLPVLSDHLEESFGNRINYLREKERVRVCSLGYVRAREHECVCVCVFVLCVLCVLCLCLSVRD